MAAKKTKTVAPPAKRTVTAPKPAPAPKLNNSAAVVAETVKDTGLVKLVCKLSYGWGTKIIVGTVDSPAGPVPREIQINADDGSLVVPKDVAAILLQNTEKYAAFPPGGIAKVPGKRLTFAEANPGIPNAIIRDPKTGRLLDDDEALRLLAPADLKSGAPGMTGKLAGEPTDPLVAQAAQASAAPKPTNIEKPAAAVDDTPAVSRDEQIAAETRKIQQEQLEAAAQVATSPAVGAEPPPTADWPTVNMDTPKGELVALLERLKGEGAVDTAFSEKTAKAKLLDLVEQGYEKLAG